MKDRPKSSEAVSVLTSSLPNLSGRLVTGPESADGDEWRSCFYRVIALRRLGVIGARSGGAC